MKIKIIFFDFDGVFTDNKVYVNQFGQESVCCNRSDGIGLRILKEKGIQCLIISSEKNNVVQERAKKLSVECFNGVENKSELIMKIVKERDVPIQQAAFIGNDINDIGAMKLVGLPIAVNDAYDKVKLASKIILKKSGGQGVVREIADLLAQKKIKI